jgi:fatty acid-binding protein DegV
MSVKIIADSACDLPSEMIEKFDNNSTIISLP